MNYLKQLIVAISLLIFTFLTCATNANTTQQYNCIDINSQYQLIEQSIDSGVLRFSNALSKDQKPTFNYSVNRTFSDYIDYAKQLIILTNPKAEQPCPIASSTTKILGLAQENTSVKDLIAPYELSQKDKHKAILLIHGLTDSPYMYHDLAAFFYQQGFTVRTLLLPGHGTAPSDLIDVSYQQWQQAVNYAIERTLKDFEQVYLGGFSTGGTLIYDYLMHKEKVSPKISGLLMWAPAYEVADEQAYLAEYVSYMPFINWLDKDADVDFAKYESFPFNAAAQIYLLTTLIAAEDDSKNYFHDIPVFTVVSDIDQTVSTAATLSLIKQWNNPKNVNKSSKDTLILYGNKKTLPVDFPSSVQVNNPKCQGRDNCSSIMGLSHSSLMISPENKHYGANGFYRNCGHYLSDITQYIACKKTKTPVLGETTAENLAQVPLLQRLTYNPYYLDMLKDIGIFLARTEK